MSDIRIIHGDCMEAMKEMPDRAFSLAIVDPPYGDGEGGQETTNNTTTSQSCVRWPICAVLAEREREQPPDWARKKRSRFGGRFDKYQVERTSGTWASKYGKDINHWDIAPPVEYFTELFRVSRFQIIWGGNYFNLPSSRNFIVWRKLTISERFTMAMAEYAWTNIQGNAKVFEYPPQDSQRFHPTQKPVRLYEWLLKNYAKPGDKILDTHGGSCSLAIACDIMGYDCTIYEIDENYYKAAVDRFEQHKMQGVLAL